MALPPDRQRRRFVGASAALALLGTPLARAQGKPLRVVGEALQPEFARASVRSSLAEAGFVAGQNLRLDYVALRGVPADVVEARAREIVDSKPDAIFMAFGPEIVLLHHLTRDIPIIFHSCPADPARGGLIASTAHPGGNVTGTYHDYRSLLLKRWALFKEVLPTLKRGAWLTSRSMLEPPAWKNREAAAAYKNGFLGQAREVNQIAERELGIRIAEIVMPDDATEEQIIERLRRERPEALRLDIDTQENGPVDRYLVSARILNELVVRAGSVPQESFNAGIGLLARVLKGERPANLPAVQGTRYVVRLNPVLAKEMGIAIPDSVRVQARLITD